MQKKIICKRCGDCCHLYIDGQKIPCRFLIKLKSGKTLCRIYKKKQRVGSVIAFYKGKKYFCSSRENSTYDYKGCPYNNGKPIINDPNYLNYSLEELEELEDEGIL